MKQFLLDIAMEKDRSVPALALRPVLLGLSLVYRVAVSLARGMYAKGFFKSYRCVARVISVGNIVAGGAGKTPFIVCLARMLRQGGRIPVVVLRGYAGGDDPDQKSDEALMLREQLKDVVICADPDRVKSMKFVEKNHLVDAFLLDDGFQHWRVKRDLDIVLIDAVAPFGNGALLPRGLLREPVSALERADVFVITRTDRIGDKVRELRRQLAGLNPQACIVETVHAPVGLTHVFSREVVKDLSLPRWKMAAFSGIGSPDGFRSTLEGLGACLNGFFVFPDHHDYTEKDIAMIVGHCRENKIGKVVTTHKDAVKMRSFQSLFSGIELFMLDIEIRVTRGEHELRSRIDILFHS